MVPFMDLKTQYLGIKAEIMAAVERVFDSTQFVLGEEVARFEAQFADFSQSAHGIGVNSGTSALHMALLAGGIGPGDEVITVPHTFVATVAAICYTGAKTVFVDIDEQSYTLDPRKLEPAVTEKTKAILPVHLYGQPADMDPIMAVARKHNLLIIEDAAQAHAAAYKGRRCGSIGDMGCFSFYPGKNLGAYGEGGMVTTANAEFARKIRMLRNWGQERKYHHVVLGYNARLAGVQAAVLRVKLQYLEQWTEARRSIARRYSEAFAGLPDVIAPLGCPDRRHVYHIYAVRVKDRDGFMAFLEQEGIQTSIHYPFAVHTLQGYAHLGYRAGDLPVAEQVASEVVSLPMFPEMTDEMVDQVVAAVRKWSGSQISGPAPAASAQHGGASRG